MSQSGNHPVVLALVLLLLMTTTVEIHCQSNVCQNGTGPGGTGTLCHCWQPDKVLNVDCSNRSLTEIPIIPDNTGVLDLTNNNIQLIHVAEFDRLDTLKRLVLTDNPLNCECDLIDFKNWVINLMSVIATAKTVEGAVCGNPEYSGVGLLAAVFCLGNRQCSLCVNATANSDCLSASICYPNDACQNELTYAIDGSVTITKSCALLADCRTAASLDNEAECRQIDGEMSRCMYCCQGNNCNQELNTIDDAYVFPFRKPLVVTTEAPMTVSEQLTTDFQLKTVVTSTSEQQSITTEPPWTTEGSRTSETPQPRTPAPLSETSSPQTTEGSRTSELTQTNTDPRTQEPLSETGSPQTDSISETSDSFLTSESSYTGTGSRTSVSFLETASWQTKNNVKTEEPSSTTESSQTQIIPSPSSTILKTDTPSTNGIPRTLEPPSTEIQQTEFLLVSTDNLFTDTESPSTEPFLTTETPQTDIGPQTTLVSATNVPHTDSLLLSTERSVTENLQTSNGRQTSVPVSTGSKFLYTDSGWSSTESFSTFENRPTESGPNTSPNAVTSQASQGTGTSVTQTSTTLQSTMDSRLTIHPSYLCQAGMTEGDKGVVTWPETGVNRTVEVPCPYSVPGDPKGAGYARRTCTWDAGSDGAIWKEPNMEECSTASIVLAELVRMIITKDNVLEVSGQLETVTSYPAALKAVDVTSAVDVLTRLLNALIQYPEKGHEIFHDAMATADQITSVKFEVLVDSQKMNRTTSRLLQLIDEFALRVPLLNSSKLTSESQAIDVIILDVDGQPIDSLLFGGSRGNNGDDAKPFVVLNESSPENMTDVVGSVHLPSTLLHRLGGQLRKTQFLLYESTTYFNVITSSVDDPHGDLKPAAEGAVTMLNSAVISASIGNLSIADLESPVLVRLKKSKFAAKNPQCAFWDTTANDNQGGWSTKGCVVNTELSDSSTVVCECDHLTNFAMLMDVYDVGPPTDPIHSKILAIISYIGCSLSILALTLAIITLGCCREESKYRGTGSGSLNIGTHGKARADRHSSILVHLSVGLILSDVSFLLNTVTVELELGNNTCLGVAVATHYSLLAAMAWMALEAFNMYLALVLVFDKYYTRFMLKMCLFGWGAPFVIVATTFSINFPDNYGLFNGICWLSRIPFLGSFLAPVCTVLLFNLLVFLAVTWQLCKMRRRNISQSRRSFDLAAQFKASASITFLFGLTWCFAIFGVGEANLAFSYLFAIFNSAQGFNIFVFQCLLKPSIRKRWMRMLRRQQEEIATSSKSSGGKDSKNVEMFKVAGSSQNNGGIAGRL